jgi:hypothetical protein
MSMFQKLSVRKKRTNREWLGYIVGELIGDAVRTWVLMLLLGAAHIHISPAIPALGFWETFLALVIISLIATDFIATGVKQALREELA